MSRPPLEVADLVRAAMEEATEQRAIVLGVALFGWNKVGPGLHFFATIMVSLGTLVSASWILASNSWMQTPQGFEIINNRVVPVDWLKVIFNPSFPFRLVHMVVAAYLATALFVGASGAWHVLKGRNTRATRTMLSMAMPVGEILLGQGAPSLKVSEVTSLLFRMEYCRIQLSLPPEAYSVFSSALKAKPV